MSPSGWEARTDGQVRTFFVDHNTKTTSWTRPTESSLPVAFEPSSSIGLETDEQLARRLQIEEESNASRVSAPVQGNTMSDEELARMLQTEEDEAPRNEPKEPVDEKSSIRGFFGRRGTGSHASKKDVQSEAVSELCSSQSRDLNNDIHPRFLASTRHPVILKDFFRCERSSEVLDGVRSMFECAPVSDRCVC